MGNQHTVKQIQPFDCHGAALKVRAEKVAEAKEIVRKRQGKCYVYFQESDGTLLLQHLDSRDTTLEGPTGAYVIIQSGGKMWCGYTTFVEHIRDIAECVEDAFFFVGDEYGFIDEFVIRDGYLCYRRLQEPDDFW